MIIITLAFLHGIFTICLKYIVSYLFPNLSKAKTYRAAFLISAGLGFFQALFIPLTYTVFHFLYAAFGSFLGIFVYISLREGLVENTLKPSKKLSNNILTLHQNEFKKTLKTFYLKRFLDFIISLTALVVLFPVWFLSILAIWFESPGPVFFIKNSTGKGGSTFPQIKFRTMVLNAEKEIGPTPSPKKDSRLLLTGKFLRPFHLDEIPQLINVLLGHMSLVGPRPLRTVEMPEFIKDNPKFVKRHGVLPGIAGLSQIMAGYYVTPRERLKYDAEYIKNLSLKLDFKILLTAVVMTLRKSRRIAKILPEMSSKEILKGTTPEVAKSTYYN